MPEWFRVVVQSNPAKNSSIKEVEFPSTHPFEVFIARSKLHEFLNYDENIPDKMVISLWIPGEWNKKVKLQKQKIFSNSLSGQEILVSARSSIGTGLGLYTENIPEEESCIVVSYAFAYLYSLRSYDYCLARRVITKNVILSTVSLVPLSPITNEIENYLKRAIFENDYVVAQDGLLLIALPESKDSNDENMLATRGKHQGKDAFKHTPDSSNTTITSPACTFKSQKYSNSRSLSDNYLFFQVVDTLPLIQGVIQSKTVVHLFEVPNNNEMINQKFLDFYNNRDYSTLYNNINVVKNNNYFNLLTKSSSQLTLSTPPRKIIRSSSLIFPNSIEIHSKLVNSTSTATLFPSIASVDPFQPVLKNPTLELSSPSSTSDWSPNEKGSANCDSKIIGGSLVDNHLVDDVSKAFRITVEILKAPLFCLQPEPDSRDFGNEIGITINTMKKYRGVTSGSWVCISHRINRKEYFQVTRVFGLTSQVQSGVHKIDWKDDAIYISPLFAFNLHVLGEQGHIELFSVESQVDFLIQEALDSPFPQKNGDRLPNPDYRKIGGAFDLPLPRKITSQSSKGRNLIIADNDINDLPRSSTSISESISSNKKSLFLRNKDQLEHLSRPKIVNQKLNICISMSATIHPVLNSLESDEEDFIPIRKALLKYFREPRILRPGDLFAVLVKKKKYLCNIEDSDSSCDENEFNSENSSLYDVNKDEPFACWMNLGWSDSFFEIKYFRFEGHSNGCDWHLLSLKFGLELRSGSPVRSRLPPFYRDFVMQPPFYPRYSNSPSTPFGELPGLEKACAAIEDIFRPCFHPLSVSLGLHVRILLSGPTGSGKTTLLEYLASKLGINLVVIDCYDLIAANSEQTEISLKDSIKRAVKSAPCIMCLNNIDAFDKCNPEPDLHPEPTVSKTLREYLSKIGDLIKHSESHFNYETRHDNYNFYNKEKNYNVKISTSSLNNNNSELHNSTTNDHISSEKSSDCAPSYELGNIVDSKISDINSINRNTMNPLVDVRVERKNNNLSMLKDSESLRVSSQIGSLNHFSKSEKDDHSVEDDNDIEEYGSSSLALWNGAWSFLYQQDESIKPVIVVGTSTQSRKLSTIIRGCFNHEINLSNPNDEERRAQLAHSLTTGNIATHVDISLDELTRQTASFSRRDLQSIIHIACNEIIRKVIPPLETIEKDLDRIKAREKDLAYCELDLCSARVPLSFSDFRTAISKLEATKANMFGIPKVPNVKWEDVGGLEHAKRDILDTIQLPLEHPELFSNGLAQRSGVLLYGPPGTGKTLLAKAVATECNLNFISVKGPELINMYIGESEKNIRQIFELSRSVQPCVIFFDELDSLAPNRGHSGDSGGVMDRIVSQLLAELSSIQKGKVFVIGATNRPDLIDPALLVPGRFDKLIFLGVNYDVNQKYKILVSQTRKFNLDPSVNLMELAELSPPNFTGADFYALCSDALLLVVKERIQAIKNQDIQSTELEKENISVVVSQEHFIKAMNQLKPSVSLKELERYTQMNQMLSKDQKNR